MCPTISASCCILGPTLVIGTELMRQLPPQVTKDAARQFAAQFRVSAGSGENTYRFISEDEKWTITLTREWLGLSTSAYERDVPENGSACADLARIALCCGGPAR